MAATEEPILSRLDRLDNILRQLEEIRGGNRTARTSTASTPSSGTLTSEGQISSLDFSSPKSLEKHCRPIDDVVMETELKGNIIERIVHVEDRLLKVCLQFEEEIMGGKEEGESSTPTTPKTPKSSSFKNKSLKKFVESCVKGKKGKYKNKHREIFARDNCKVKGQKGLDVVKVHDMRVVLLYRVCMGKHEPNLIVVNRYTYFADKESSTRSLSEDGIDEFEMMEALSCLLQKLKKVHRLCFERDTCSDVRELLDTVGKEFVMPGMDATTTALPISAEQVGAVCLDNKFLVRLDERKEPEKKSAVRASSELKSAKRKRSNEDEYEAEYENRDIVG